MSEKWTGESAEKEFTIDNEGGYYRACKLAVDSVEYLQEFREHLLSENFSEIDVASIAISEVHELEIVIGNEDIPIIDERLRDFTVAPSASEKWAMSLFSILKDAGYSKVEIATYIALDDPEFTHEERLREKGLNIYLNRVYAEK